MSSRKARRRGGFPPPRQPPPPAPATRQPAPAPPPRPPSLPRRNPPDAPPGCPRGAPSCPVGVLGGAADPGVGTERKPIAIRTGRGAVFVGPDNGLFMPATERVGGIVEARVLENRELWLASATSSTFHGRDIFSPV